MSRRTRRNFLKVGGAGAVAAGLAACSAAPPTASTAAPTTVPTTVAIVPPTTPSTAEAVAVPQPVAPAPEAVAPRPTPPVRTVVPAAQRTLVVIQLGGGDDGLNFLAPYGDGTYYDARPKVALQPGDVLPLNEMYGLHPSLKAFKNLHDNGKIALVHGVGYPNPSRSHFKSMDILHTARLDGNAEQGWLGAFMAEIYKVGESPFRCVNMGVSIPKALLTPHAPTATVQDLNTFQFLADRRLTTGKDPLLKTFGQMYARPSRKLPEMELVAQGWDSTSRGVETLGKSSEKHQSAVPYPNNPFGKSLQQVAQMIATDIGTRVFYVSIGGFDTHSNQKMAHANLLTTVSEGIAVFQQDLEQAGKADGVTILGFSEFGRRVKENGSNGTDHGAAGPMFVVGNGIKGGLYGDPPSLTNLDSGDLRYTVDFRQVYATILENWFEMPSQAALGGSFERLGFIA